MKRRRPIPELPAPSLWDGADERWILVCWLDPGLAGTHVTYRAMRSEYEEDMIGHLPAKPPTRKRRRAS